MSPANPFSLMPSNRTGVFFTPIPMVAYLLVHGVASLGTSIPAGTVVTTTKLFIAAGIPVSSPNIGKDKSIVRPQK